MNVIVYGATGNAGSEIVEGAAGATWSQGDWRGEKRGETERLRGVLTAKVDDLSNVDAIAAGS